MSNIPKFMKDATLSSGEKLAKDHLREMRETVRDERKTGAPTPPWRAYWSSRVPHGLEIDTKLMAMITLYEYLTGDTLEHVLKAKAKMYGDEIGYTGEPADVWKSIESILTPLVVKIAAYLNDHEIPTTVDKASGWGKE